MALAALILLLLAAGLITATVMGGDSMAFLHFGLFNVHTSSKVIFFLGMAAAALIFAGLWLFAVSIRSARRRRRDHPGRHAPSAPTADA